MKLKQINLFEQFVQASTNQEYEQLHDLIKHGGYAYFSELLTELRQFVMRCEESELDLAKQLISKGKSIIPHPQLLSPSWAKVWDDYDRLIKYKQEALMHVLPAEREGEWQIIIDNPFTNEGITVYPGLSFVEAAYLYGYFRKDLAKNEYIRLQKITNLLMATGYEN